MRIQRPWGSLGNSYFDINAEFKLFDGKRGILAQGSFPLSQLSQISPGTQDKEFSIEISPVPWGKATVLQILFTFNYVIIFKPDVGLIPAIQANGKRALTKDWKIFYSNDGIRFDAQHETYTPVPPPSGNFSIELQLQAYNSQPYEQNQYATLVVQLKGVRQKQSFDVNLPKPPIAPTQPPPDIESHFLQLKFKSKLKFFGKPTTKGAIQKLPNLPRGLFKEEVIFDNEKDAELGANALREIQNWIAQLQNQAPEIFNIVRDGMCTVFLDGYATTTGSAEFNKELSAKRNDAVARQMTRLFNSNKIRFKKTAHGKDNAIVPGRGATFERRVEIVIPVEEVNRSR